MAIYNSEFTKQIVEKNLPLPGKVVYPPVDVANLKSLPKSKQILNVGRFVASSKIKKQHIMAQAFRDLITKNHLKDWSFHLAGGVLPGDEVYVEELKKDFEGFPIYFYPNVDLETIKLLYGQSAIYWHAMGYEETDPVKFEHFGISTVEAMAAGAVPVVINKGGQKEIIENNITGFLWDNLDQLADLTLKLISDPALLDTMSQKAQQRAKLFSKEEFIRNIKNIVYETN